jgi:hypothetical protein
MNIRNQIDGSRLQQLYVNDRMTLEAIASLYKCSPTTIRRRLRETGIKTHSRGPQIVRSRQLNWSPQLAYVVGLIATDGNLSSDGRHLTMTSADVDLLETVRSCLGLTNNITPHKHSGFSTQVYHRLQWSDHAFYAWLSTIGLVPAKSLKLGPLAIPDAYFPDFMRGCIDGDGTIVTYIDSSNTTKNPNYRYKRLFVALVSASRPFLTWVHRTLIRLLGLKGGLYKSKAKYWSLKYMKKDAIRLLRWMYYADDVPCLARKRGKALPFLAG